MGQLLHRRSLTSSAELWESLPPEAQQIYSDLDPAHEGQVGTSRRRENRVALEVLVSLCDQDYEIAASTLIPRYSPHLRGSSLEQTLHRRAIEARSDPHLSRIMNPAIGQLIDAGIREIFKYVKSGRPLSMESYRRGFLLLKTAALFSPQAVRDVRASLNKTFGPYGDRFPIIDLLLASIAGWGSDPNVISSGDIVYLDFWKRPCSQEIWAYCANHVLAYYAPARRGSHLVEMIPSDAKKEMIPIAHLIRQSLIDEAKRKEEEGYANAAWVGATYEKVHDGITFLDGGWTKLSIDQARKLQDFILFARHKTQCLDGPERRRLHAKMGSVETTLIRTEYYNLQAKVYKGAL